MYLTVTNLAKTFNGSLAIADINFDLEKGQLLCLLGPSGCGKSTVLNAIGGFFEIDSGRIMLDGEDITNVPPENRDISTVFQSYGLFPHMTVLQNVTYGLKFRRIKKAERRRMGLKMLATMGLVGFENRKVAQLSGGQQQRVALARSLIINPKLLLLDEPLSNLDAKLRIAMRQEIKRIQAEFGTTMIFVTHDQEEAFEIADQVILMDKGRIMQMGAPQDLYDAPQNAFALDFIGSANHLNGSYVRPEKISVSDDGQPAIITAVIFKGAFIELQIELQNGLQVAVNQPPLSTIVLNQGHSYQVGDEIKVKYQVAELPEKTEG